MGFLMVILLASVLPILLTKAAAFPGKLDQVLMVPLPLLHDDGDQSQVPDSDSASIKHYCMECVNKNPCPCAIQQHPPPPPPPPSSTCWRLAPPPPPRLTYTMSDLEDKGNLYDDVTDSNSNLVLIVIIVILVLVGLGVLLWRCAGPCNRILEDICF